jgi:hypothetical protein
MLEKRGTSPAFFMDEIWKSIPGYETHYEASSHGRVRSRRRLVVDIRNDKERRRIFKERILSPNIQVSRGSRHSVMLSVQGKTKRILIARLVCLAFHGLPPEGKENVLHYDDDSSNNVPENLRWGTHKENAADMRRNLGYWPAYIDGRSKRLRKPLGDPLMNEAQVRVLKRLPDMRSLRGLRTDLAKAWGIKPSTITSARDGGKGWVDLTDEPLWDMAERLSGELVGREKSKRKKNSLNLPAYGR